MRDTISSVSSYDRVNSAFENAVIRMQENLQYLADNDKVSDKFLSMQNLILKNLIDYQQRTERYISTLEMENARLASGRIREIEQLKDIKESFEALCIIHGIMDFPIWMNRGKNYLVQEAIYHYKENMITLPYSLKEWIDKLAEADQKVFYK